MPCEATVDDFMALAHLGTLPESEIQRRQLTWHTMRMLRRSIFGKRTKPLGRRTVPLILYVSITLPLLLS